MFESSDMHIISKFDANCHFKMRFHELKFKQWRGKGHRPYPPQRMISEITSPRAALSDSLRSFDRTDDMADQQRQY